MYTQSRRGALETSLCQRGMAQRALKHLAKWGAGEGTATFPSGISPQSAKSPHGWYRGREREREKEEDRGFRRSLGKGKAFSHL